MAILPALRANLILNPGFENPTVPNANNYYTLSTNNTGPTYVSSLTNWTFTNNNVAIYGSNYTNTIGAANGGYVSNGQLIDLTDVSSNAGNGSISQSIATVVGQKYA